MRSEQPPPGLTHEERLSQTGESASFGVSLCLMCYFRGVLIVR